METRVNCLETMTLDDMEWEIGEGKRRISEAIPGQVDFRRGCGAMRWLN